MNNTTDAASAPSVSNAARICWGIGWAAPAYVTFKKAHTGVRLTLRAGLAAMRDDLGRLAWNERRPSGARVAKPGTPQW
jgi:hypothetical protein